MSSAGFTDPIAGINGALAVMTALLYGQTTGTGQYIDLSQVEAVTSLIGDAIIEYTMNNSIQPRRGNRHPFAAPHGCYRCKSEDRWLDLAVYTDNEWRAFCRVTGNPRMAEDERFKDSLSRWQNQDELDKIVETWTIQHNHIEAMYILQRAGITAGAVLSSAELLNDPHLKERGTFQILERAVVGTHPYPVPTAPMRFEGVATKLERPAPTMGQHNEYVLGELLGLSHDEIASLEKEQVIGKRPLGL
jgi:crotonobetainyl-CoA:carnitine CoA-transferase CaiB-like acyl-CoA transferase